MACPPIKAKAHAARRAVACDAPALCPQGLFRCARSSARWLALRHALGVFGGHQRLRARCWPHQTQHEHAAHVSQQAAFVQARRDAGVMMDVKLLLLLAGSLLG